MALRPLTPQSPERIEWEQAVCLAIENAEEVTTSDAQAIMEATPELVDDCFTRDMEPARAAKRILGPADQVAPAQHTAEPWALKPHGVVYGGKPVQCARGEVQQQIAMFCHLEDGDQEANAARAVACVNACAGMDVAEIERLRENNEARAERDDLLRALRVMTRTFLDGSHYETQNPYTRDYVKKALIAIARAEGKSTFGNDWMDAIDMSKPEAA